MNETENASFPAPQGNGEIIFVVEDDGDVRRMTVQQLKNLGYQTIEAADGAQAIVLLESGIRFDCLFSDVIMPGGLSGFDVAKKVRMYYPDIPVLLTSGFSGAAVKEIQDLMPSVRLELLAKPYRKADLAGKIREVLDKKFA
jgi:CheY-like chemotaxis protein